MGLYKSATRNLRSGIHSFEHKAGGTLRKVGSLAVKSLPIIEKVAKGVATGIKYSAPAIAVLAPELLPFAVGAGALANTVGKAAGSARKIIRAGQDVVAGTTAAKKLISGIEKPAPKPIMKIAVPPMATSALRRIGASL